MPIVIHWISRDEFVAEHGGLRQALSCIAGWGNVPPMAPLAAIRLLIWENGRTPGCRRLAAALGRDFKSVYLDLKRLQVAGFLRRNGNDWLWAAK